MGLKDFLRAVPKHRSFVVGNMACDYDSVASSIVLGYALGICPVARKRLPIEAEHILKKLGVDSIIDESAIDHSLQRDVWLVDHNAAEGVWKSKSTKVVGIVDHHADLGEHLDASPRLISLVGSCCSLVSSLLHSDSFPVKNPVSNNDEVCLLLLGGILLDTGNLSEGRARELDKTEAARLASVVLARRGIASDALYNELIELRFNKHVQGKTWLDMLADDFKEYQVANELAYGISSVTLDLASMVVLSNMSEAAILHDLNAFVHSHGLAFLLIMTMVPHENSFAREIAVFRPTTPQAKNTHELQAYRGQFAIEPTHLLQDVAPVTGMQLEPFVLAEACMRRAMEKVAAEGHILDPKSPLNDLGDTTTFLYLDCFKQRNMLVSRKVLQPPFHSVFTFKYLSYLCGRIPEWQSDPAKSNFYDLAGKFQRGYASAGFLLHVADHEAGFFVAHERDGRYYLWLLAVMPEHRRKGLSVTLIRQFELVGVQRGFSRFSVKTHEPGMIKALTTCGYHHVHGGNTYEKNT